MKAPFLLGLLGRGLAAAALLLAPSSGHGGDGRGLLTLDSLLDIRHPSAPAFSPDGSVLAFVWERASVQNIYAVGGPLGTSAPPRPLTAFEEGDVEGLFWSADGRHLYFGRAGDLWSVAADGRTPAAPVWRTPEAETDVAPSPDGTRVVFVRGETPEIPAWQRTQGDVYVRSLADGREVRLSQGGGVASGPAFSPDGRRVVFTLASAEARTSAPSYSGTKVLFRRVDHGAARAVVVEVGGGPPVNLPESPGWGPSPHWIDARRLVLLRVADEGKAREVLLADAATGATRVLFREEDPLFWSLDFIAPEAIPSPGGRFVAFVSDRDGFDHLYVAPATGGPPVAITKGGFEVRSPAWSPDGRRIAFDASEALDPGVRHVVVATLAPDGRSARLRRLTAGRGTNVGPVWAPDGRSLVFQHADPRQSADLLRVAAEGVDGGPPPKRRGSPSRCPRASTRTGSWSRPA